MNRAFWFPEQPRSFPFRRSVRTVLRTFHIVAAGVLLGAYLFGQAIEVTHVWLALTLASGLLLFITDVHATFAVLFEWRGLVTAVKLIMLGLVARFPEMAIYLLAAAMLLGTYISHVSRDIRHRFWWKPAWVVRTDDRKG